MKLKLLPYYFVTKSFVFGCDYETIINKLENISYTESDLKNIASYHYYSLINSFLNVHETSLSKDIFKYGFKRKGKDVSTKEARDSKYSLFFLKKTNIKRVLENSEILTELNCCWKKYYESINKLITITNNIVNKNPKNVKRIKVIINELNQIYQAISKKSNLSIATLKSNCASVDRHMHELKELSFFLNDNIPDSYFSLFSEADKNFDMVDSFIETFDFINDINCLFAVLVDRNNTLSFSIFYSEGDYKKVNVKDVIYDVNNNHLIEQSIYISNEISSKMNKLPKIFSHLYLNAYLGFVDDGILPIYDDPKFSYKPLLNKEVVYNQGNEIINKKTSVQKAIYLKFIDDYNHGKNQTVDRSSMICFDYVSLLVAYNHNYDPYVLWRFLNNDKEYTKKEMKKRVIDLNSEPTEHIYYDDSTFLISTINPIVNKNEIIRMVPTKNTSSLIRDSSHQSRYYGLWHYSYICNSLAYGSSISLLLVLLQDYSSKAFAKAKCECAKTKALHIYSHVSSQLLNNINIISSSAKADATQIVNIVNKKLEIDNVSSRIEEISKITWRDSNLTNTRYYNRLGIMLTLFSLTITVASFGMISKVYVIGYADAICCKSDPPPTDFLPLFIDILKTCKVYLVIILGLLSCLVFYLLIHLSYLRSIKTKLVKKCGFEIRKLTKMREKDEKK